jgi:hypothetical protein
MSTVALVIAALVQYGPVVAKEIQLMLAKTDPTQADWDALFALASKPYASYVTGTTTAHP